MHCFGIRIIPWYLEEEDLGSGDDRFVSSQSSIFVNGHHHSSLLD